MILIGCMVFIIIIIIIIIFIIIIIIIIIIDFIYRRLQLLVKNIPIQIDKEIHSYHKKKVNLNILDLLWMSCRFYIDKICFASVWYWIWRDIVIRSFLYPRNAFPNLRTLKGSSVKAISYSRFMFRCKGSWIS